MKPENSTTISQKRRISIRFLKKLLPVPYSELKAAGVLEEPAKQAIKEAVAKAKARAREADEVALAVLSSFSRPQDQQAGASVGQSSKWLSLVVRLRIRVRNDLWRGHWRVQGSEVAGNPWAQRTPR